MAANPTAPNSGPNPGPNPGLFFDTVNSYQKTYAVRAAVDLKLFTAIGEGHDTAAKMAARCNAAERGVRILADYLTVNGFLTKQGDKYVLTQDSAVFLNEHSPAYAGRIVDFLVTDYLVDNFSDLTNRVRNGGAPANDSASLAPNHDMWVKFARGMAGMFGMQSQLLAKEVLAGSTAPMKVLDIAAGHGLYGVAFAQQNPAVKVVSQDWSNVLEVAQEHADKAGVTARFEKLPGSAFDVDYGTGYDIVLVTNFLHHFDAATCTKLMKKIHAALKPGGRAVIVEFVPNEDRVSPPVSACFSLIMLAQTPAGDAYTFKEIETMCSEAGFAKSECKNLMPTMQQVVTAVK